MKKTTILLSLLLTSICFGKQIVVTSDDTMKFNVSEITVEAGSENKLLLKNVGQMPKSAMGHNLVILKAGTDINKFGMAAMTAAASAYIPQDSNKSDVIAHTKILGPNESDEITFTLSKGEYPFICSFPGHYAMMKGIIISK